MPRLLFSDAISHIEMNCIMASDDPCLISGTGHIGDQVLNLCG